MPGLGRSPGEGKGYPFQYSGPENSMDCIVREKSQTQLSDFHTHTHTHTNYDFPGGEKKKTSLTVPWLRLCASPVGGIGSIPNRETKISCIPPSQKKKGKKTLNYMRC